MSDIFADIMEVTVSDKTTAEPSASSSSKGKEAKSSSEESRSSKKKDKKSDSRNSEPDRLDKLSSIMEAGFSNLQQLLQGCIGNPDYEDVQPDFDEESFCPSDAPDADLFTALSEELGNDGKLGDEVPESLAKLTNKLLRTKLETSDKDKYLRPQNIEFLEAPQINKPVWSNISHNARTNDCTLQAIQRDFLKSAIPTLSVMQKLNDSKEDPSSLDIKDLIRTLSDSLAFLGSANTGMIKARRSFLKKELPPNMHLLCNESVEFSGSNLFGDSLSSDIKEVSELNKVSSQLRGRGSVRGRGVFRSNFSSRGNRGYAFKSRNSNRFGPRFNPIRSQSRKGSFPLNRVRPSKKEARGN